MLTTRTSIHSRRFLSHVLLLTLGALCAVAVCEAHHSYAMFDGTKTVTVEGTVAKLEWVNPHTFLWVYVPSANAASGYELYAFENGSPAVLAQRGWSKAMFAVGEPVSVEYWPLRDGRSGGHLAAVRRADGSTTRGVGGPRGANGDLETDAAAAAQSSNGAAR